MTEKLNAVGVLRVLADLSERMTLGRDPAGLTFGGKRDVSTALGFKRILNPADYRKRFNRGGLAGRVVECKPQATWSEGIEIVEDQDPLVSTQFEEAWVALNERLNLWSTFYRADVLAGIGRYAIIWLGLPGAPDTEAAATFNADDLVYLMPYAEDDARISAYDEDPESPRFGQPTLYLVRSTAGNKRAKATNVHWSRVLHIADGALDSLVFGRPRLELVWDYFDSLDKVVGGGAEAFWQRVNQGMHLDLAVPKEGEETVLEPADIEALKSAMDDYANGMRRHLLTRGAELKMLGSDVANFSNPADAIITLIAGTVGIPKRILTGSERGDLASSQDATNWQTQIADRRTQYAEPVIVRAFIDRLVKAKALPAPVSYNVRWPERETVNETERATIATAWADLNAKAGKTVVTPEEIRDLVLKLPPLAVSSDQEAKQIFSTVLIQAAIQLVMSVAAGDIPRDAAVTMLVVMFGIEQADAELLIQEPTDIVIEPPPEQLALPPAPGEQVPPPPPGEQTPPPPQVPPVGATRGKARRSPSARASQRFTRLLTGTGLGSRK